MLWTSFKQWFADYAQVIAIIEAGILALSGPVSFWRWLTMRDRHEALMAEIKGLRRQLKESGIKPKAANELFTPEFRRALAKTKFATRYQKKPKTIAGKVLDWLWHFLVKPTLVLAVYFLILAVIVWTWP